MTMRKQTVTGLPPGTRAPESGQYRAIGPRGGTGAVRTVNCGERLPPTPKPGMRYRLVGSFETSASLRPMEGNAMDESEFLLRNPENARRLRRSIADAKAGRVIHVNLNELEAEM